MDRAELIKENFRLGKKIEELRTQQINWLAQLCELVNQIKEAKKAKEIEEKMGFESDDFYAGYISGMESTKKWVEYKISNFKKDM